MEKIREKRDRDTMRKSNICPMIFSKQENRDYVREAILPKEIEIEFSRIYERYEFSRIYERYESNSKIVFNSK